MPKLVPRRAPSNAQRAKAKSALLPPPDPRFDGLHRIARIARIRALRRARSARAARAAGLALLALLALPGCQGPGGGLARVASTLEVGAGHTDHHANDSLGNPLYSDSSQLWVTVRPLAFLEPPTRVVIVGGK
jgi:hypothetical protein